MSILLMLSSVMLLLAGGYFTLKFKLFYIRHPIKTVKSVSKDGIKQMLLSLGGTVGVGNIAGVSVAIALGGGGAVFWMWCGAAVAMALKYAEIILGMLHGNTLHYIKKAFGSIAAALFALLLVTDAIVMGGIIQSSAVAQSMELSFGLSRVICGIFLSLLAAAVFFFNIDLFRLSSVVVPLMSIGYAMAALAVTLFNVEKIPAVLQEILKDAFTCESAAGGLFGFLFTPALRQGIVKGLFSNEAGCGTAPMAHAASKEKVPARQGLFGIFEVFIDTILMCTLTAFAVLLTDNGSFGGVRACINAFESVLGKAAAPMISVAVFLFAFCTIISLGYYGTESIAYFLGKSQNGIFLLAYCISVFVGATLSPAFAWAAADIVVSVMLIINTSAVFLCRREIISAHNDFYCQIGNSSQSASKMRFFSSASAKKESPMSQRDIKRGSISKSRQNLAK